MRGKGQKNPSCDGPPRNGSGVPYIFQQEVRTRDLKAGIHPHEWEDRNFDAIFPIPISMRKWIRDGKQAARDGIKPIRIPNNVYRAVFGLEMTPPACPDSVGENEIDVIYSWAYDFVDDVWLFPLDSEFVVSIFGGIFEKHSKDQEASAVMVFAESLVNFSHDGANCFTLDSQEVWPLEASFVKFALDNAKHGIDHLYFLSFPFFCWEFAILNIVPDWRSPIFICFADFRYFCDLIWLVLLIRLALGFRDFKDAIGWFDARLFDTFHGDYSPDIGVSRCRQSCQGVCGSVFPSRNLDELDLFEFLSELLGDGEVGLLSFILGGILPNKLVYDELRVASDGNILGSDPDCESKSCKQCLIFRFIV
ncbi:unnamed protein product [Cochlearia groenlandica]